MTKNDPKKTVHELNKLNKKVKKDKKDEESCPNDGTKMHNEKAGIWCRGKGQRKEKDEKVKGT